MAIEIHHGMCHGCKAQESHGLNYCNGCKYRNYNRHLPNLFTNTVTKYTKKTDPIKKVFKEYVSKTPDINVRPPNKREQIRKELSERKKIERIKFFNKLGKNILNFLLYGPKGRK